MKINAFPMRYEIWKEMLNSPVKGGLELGPSRQKAGIYAAEMNMKCGFI